MNTATIGTKVFNHGDMANHSMWGTITEIKTDRFGVWFVVKYDNGLVDHMPKSGLSKTYKGHAGTRVVTEAAYNESRQQLMA